MDIIYGILRAIKNNFSMQKTLNDLFQNDLRILCFKEVWTSPFYPPDSRVYLLVQNRGASFTLCSCTKYLWRTINRYWKRSALWQLLWDESQEETTSQQRTTRIIIIVKQNYLAPHKLKKLSRNLFSQCPGRLYKQAGLCKVIALNIWLIIIFNYFHCSKSSDPYHNCFYNWKQHRSFPCWNEIWAHGGLLFFQKWIICEHTLNDNS